MEEAVLALIDRYDVAAQCVIASMDDAVLKKVKELNPDIKTAYITAVAYGDFEGLKEADMFSIEATFATRGLISRLHGIGKPVYVWTVNSEDQMRRTLEAGADGIVTDNQMCIRDRPKLLASSTFLVSPQMKYCAPCPNLARE